MDFESWAKMMTFPVSFIISSILYAATLDAAGLTVAESDIAFTVRFCKRAAEVTADGFRILFGGEIYNIAAVDHMNYKKKTLKFRCEKARR